MENELMKNKKSHKIEGLNNLYCLSTLKSIKFEITINKEESMNVIQMVF